MADVIGTSGRDSDGINSAGEIWNGEGCLVREVCTIHWRRMMRKLKRKSRERLCSVILPLPMAYEMTRRKVRRLASLIHSVENGTEEEDEEGEGVRKKKKKKPSLRNFEFRELAAATSNFSTENMIGRGGNGEVYKGWLENGEAVAIKKVMNKRRKEKEEKEIAVDFLTEVGIVAHIDHPNVAQVIGFSVDNGFFLVLEFAPHGSLASLLHSPPSPSQVAEVLPWPVRYNVALGVACGLHYLHHDCHRRIIHRDIKASNILLSRDYTPLISDFGLAKWLRHDSEEHIIFQIEGTFGYLPPEYMAEGVANEKGDVFAFGVLLLELITGRRAISPQRRSLAMWAKPLLEEGRTVELADPQLEGAYDATEMEAAMAVASACVQHTASNRPTMKLIVQMLHVHGPQKKADLCGSHHPILSL